MMMLIDELKVYRGKPIDIGENIIIYQPTLDQICEQGEAEYFSTVNTICATPSTMTFQLFDVGIDFTEISDFTLFSEFLCHTLAPDKTKLLFGDLDFTAYELKYSEDLKEPVLYNATTESMITDFTYQILVGYVRSFHGLKNKRLCPKNEKTKMNIIEDDREEFEFSKMEKKQSSMIVNQISTLINSPGSGETHKTVWDLPISVFTNSLQRIAKMENAKILLQSGYSGFGVDLKKISKKELDWMGSL